MTTPLTPRARSGRSAAAVPLVLASLTAAWAGCGGSDQSLDVQPPDRSGQSPDKPGSPLESSGPQLLEPHPPVDTAHVQLVFRADPEFDYSHDRMTPAEAMLTLLPDGVGILTLSRGEPNVVAWSNTPDGARVDGGSTHGGFGNQLEWSLLVLRLTDTDGDGVVDAGEGRVSGARFSSTWGDTHAEWKVATHVEVVRDVAGPTVALQGESAWDVPLLPVSPVRILVSEPVVADEALARIAIRASGAVVRGTLSATQDGGPVRGLATSFSFAPARPWPFGTELSVQVDRLTDPGGNPATAQPDTIHVMADPGSLLGNRGFERGLTGWAVDGDVRVHVGEMSLKRWGVVTPARGTAFAVIEAPGRLVGYVDVPPTASTLRLWVAAFPEAAFEPGVSAVIRLMTRDETIDVFDAAAQRRSKEFVPQAPVEVNIARLRGRRVFLVAEAASAGFIGVNYSMMTIDDVSVR